MKELRLGTIGTGPIVHTILDQVKAVNGIRLTTVYSRSEEKGNALAAEYGASRVYTDLDAFLGDEEMNVIYIASPNLLHYEQTKKALLAGKHVICEKPFCTKAEQVKELTALAKEKHLFLADAVPTAFLPNLEILKRELPKVGKVRLVMGNYSQYSSRYDLVLKGEVPNVFNKEFGGGCLMDINFYNAYLNVALFGKPQAAVYYPNIDDQRKSDELCSGGDGKLADTSGTLVMQYDGFVSSSAGAKDTWGVNYFQIEGEKGYIYIKDGSNGIAEVRVVTKETEEIFNMQDQPDHRFYEIEKLTEYMLREDYETVYNLLDVTRDVMEVLENVRKKVGILFPGD